MTSSQEQYQQERAALAQRYQDSQAEVEAIRAQLKAHQERLSELEQRGAELTNRAAQIQALISDAESKRDLVGPELTARLMGPLQEELTQVQAQLQAHQQTLSDAHQTAAQVAQSLAPAFQKQKRFEEAVASLDAMFASEQAQAPQAQAPQAQAPQAQAPQAQAPQPHALHITPKDDPVRQARVPLHSSIRFECEISKESESNFYTGFTDNISEGGVFIATDQLIELETELSFALSLPTLAAPCELKGVVRWVRHAENPDFGSPNGVGVQFISLPQDVKRAISDFIKQRESIFYDE